MLCAELHPFSIKSHLRCQKTVISYHLISQLYIYIYIYIYIKMWHWCILLATYWQVQRRLFGNTLVTGQRKQLLPNRTTIPLQYMFPCRNNNAQNGASNLTTRSLTKHSNILCPPLHYNSHTHTHMHTHNENLQPWLG